MGGLASALFGLLWADTTDQINPGWAATGVLGTLTTALLFILRWLAYVWLPQEREEKKKQIELLIQAAADERALAEARRRVDLAAAEKRSEEAEVRCEANTDRLVATVKEQAEKDREANRRDSEKDRELYRRTTEQSLGLLQYLVEQERGRESPLVSELPPPLPRGGRP